MQVSEYIVDYLAKKGVKFVFGFPGGSIVTLLDAIERHPNIKYVGSHHEQASAFAAEGYARVSHKVGVVLATNGPGATNLITGIASAFCDSIPVLYLTGQARISELKKPIENLRQKAFQEIDIISVVKPITKYSALVKDASEIKIYLDKAFHEMLSGRSGPVLLDLPIDVQMADINPALLQGFNTSNPLSYGVDPDVIDKIVLSLKMAQRPVILAGGGIRLSGSEKLFNEFLRKIDIPVVYSLMGKDAICGEYSYNCGLIGIYGTRHGNILLSKSDLIISFGARLDKRQTGKDLSLFAKKAKIIRIDIDSHELKNKIKNDELTINADLNGVLSSLLSRKLVVNNINQWKKLALFYLDKYKTESILQNPNPNIMMKRLSEIINDDAIIVSDVGQNQMWLAQSGADNTNRRYLFDGGLGSMGCSLPMAIGASIADSTKQVVSISGDGGFAMNIQELQTIVRNKLPIKIVIINNNCLGMIRVMQDTFFDRRYVGTIDGFDNPDYVSIARAYGIESIQIKYDQDFTHIIELLSNNKTELIEIILPNTTDVLPKPLAGHPLEDSEPLLPREEFKNIIENL